MEAQRPPAHLIIYHVQALSRRTTSHCAATGKTEQIKHLVLYILYIYIYKRNEEEVKPGAQQSVLFVSNLKN